MKRFLDIARRIGWVAGGALATKLVLSFSVPLPDGAAITRFVEGSRGGLLGLYNYLGGGALERGSAFALGIMPYLSARIFVALLRTASTRARVLGRTELKWLTRGVTVGFAVIQSIGYARFTQNLPGAVSEPGLLYTAEMIVVLMSVSTLLMLFAEEATSPDGDAETPMLPRERAGVDVGMARERGGLDAVYISHPTPAP